MLTTPTIPDPLSQRTPPDTVNYDSMTQDEQDHIKLKTLENAHKYRSKLASLTAQAHEYQQEMNRALPFLEAITGEKPLKKMVYVDAGGRIDPDDYYPEGNLPTTDTLQRLFREIGQTQRQLLSAQARLREWGAID